MMVRYLPLNVESGIFVQASTPVQPYQRTCIYYVLMILGHVDDWNLSQLDRDAIDMVNLIIRGAYSL